MRRAWAAVGIVLTLVLHPTSAIACTLVGPPMYLSASIGGPGTGIRATGYCQEAGTVQLQLARSEATKPIDSASFPYTDGSFDVTIVNKYAPPLPPGAPYRFDMEVVLRCGDLRYAASFFATDYSTDERGHVYAVASEAPANVRAFVPAGAVNFNYYDNNIPSAAGSIAAMERFDQYGEDRLIVGSGSGSEATFTIGGLRWVAYPQFPGGVNVAAGDVDGNGTQDIVTGAGPGGGPHIKVWKVPRANPDPRAPQVPSCGPSYENTSGFYAYDPAFAGGVSVAAADLDLDGRAEIITGALGGGGPHVRVFDEFGNLKSEFMAYDAAFHGGVNVAARDLLSDGRGDIVTGAGPGGGPHVRVFTQTGRELSSFYAYAPEFHGGVFVAAGHPTPGASPSIVTGPGVGGGPHVRVLDAFGNGPGGFFAYGNTTAGVRVAVSP